MVDNIDWPRELGLHPPVKRSHVNGFVLQVAYYDDHKGVVVRDSMLEAHEHIIKESWSTQMKESVAKHMDTFHRP